MVNPLTNTQNSLVGILTEAEYMDPANLYYWLYIARPEITEGENDLSEVQYTNEPKG